MASKVRPSAFCSRYLVFCLNVLLIVLSSILLFIAAYAIHHKESFDKLHLMKQSKTIKINPAVVMCVCSIIFWLGGLCGMLGALRENVLLLRLYIIFNGILFIILLSIVVLFTVLFESFTVNFLRKYMHEAIVSYRFDPDLTNIIDWLQNDLGKCCGVESPMDWQNNIYFNCSSQVEYTDIKQVYKPPDACSVPWSCCSNGKNNTFCGRGFLKLYSNTVTSGSEDNKQDKKFENIYTRGCLESVLRNMVKYPIMVIAISSTLLIIPLMTICAAITIINRVNRYS
ncbi:hypothetical protein GJ496_005913 [Pomphorhynchus laevis]|nr:hypothetical protein GJ496_005913 [Pomphorhynchus laevis]